ncbi:hypothetical protein AYO20_11582 [Fonsecaea nubica]|uniref:Uncharacterized protein n=1 Tax=Fonsecaea nubica TaxID=856822 RepID=A0A178BPY2_9EURO|nr:hypothetical protein AYO20_11582 [Fonsecaea nubica]OAL19728.1 hypothetical protein AYO20_11582 [Fonsecaea nubica]
MTAQANNFDFFCQVNNLPVRSGRRELPAPFVEAHQRGVNEAKQLLQTSGEMRPTWADANMIPETIEPDIRRPSPIDLQTTSMSDLCRILDEVANEVLGDDDTIPETIEPVIRRPSPVDLQTTRMSDIWRILDEVADEAFGDDDAESSYSTRNSLQRLQSGSRSTIFRPVDDSWLDLRPEVDDGQNQEYNPPSRHTPTGRPQPLSRSSSSSGSTVKPAKYMKDAGGSEEPGTTSVTAGQEEDEILVGSSIRPLATFVIHRPLPSEQKAPSPWQRFARWWRTSLCCGHDPGDQDAEDIEPGVIKVSQTTRVEMVDMSSGPRQEEMTMEAAQDKKKWVPVEGQPF